MLYKRLFVGCGLAWISCQRVGKYGGRCVEERIGSFLVRKTQQASRGSLAMFLRIFQLVSESL